MISTSTLQTDFYGIQTVTTEQNITFKMCLALNIFNKKSRSGGQDALETLWAARLAVIVLCVGAHEDHVHVICVVAVACYTQTSF